MLLFFLTFFSPVILSGIYYQMKLMSSQLCGCFSWRCRLFRSIGPLLLQILGNVRNYILLGWVRVQLSSSPFSCHRQSLLVLVFKIWFLVITSMLFFIARGWLHGLVISFHLFFPFYSLILLHFSSLLASLFSAPNFY